MKKLFYRAAPRFALAVAMIAAGTILCAETITVGPGEGEGALREAIGRAADGDVIVLGAGDYRLPDSLFIEEKNNLEIRGEGEVVISCAAYVPVFHISDSSEITIRNLRARHQVTDPDVGKGECGPGATIISAYACAGLYVYDCELDGSGQIGLDAVSCERVTLKGNYIHDNVYGALALNFAESGKEPGVIIENNRIENNFGPLILVAKEGRLQMFFKDSAEAPGLVMKNNKWKNNDRMPRVVKTLAGKKVAFWGKPYAYEDEQGREVIYSGVLNERTTFVVGKRQVSLMGRSEARFYENGAVRGGLSAVRINMKIEGKTYQVPVAGRLEFYESGVLRSAELEDGGLLLFNERGGLEKGPAGRAL